MWLVKTRSDGEIEAPFLEWSSTMVQLKSECREKTSWEVRDWKKLWLKKKTLRKVEDVRYTFFFMPVGQFISAMWIEKAEKDPEKI